MAARMARRFVVLLLISFAYRADATEPIEELLEATFRVTDDDHSGTGFLIASSATDPDRPRRVILATAAHVFEQMSGNECQIMLRTKAQEDSYLRSPHRLAIRNQGEPLWTRHPDVDIATLQFDLPEGVYAKPFSLEQIADASRVHDRTVRVAAETWIPCFPAKLEANEAGWPVLRRGSIASHPLSPVKSAKTLLVDYQAFGGDSGAPVVMVVDNRPLVVGVVHGMHRQTDRSVLPFEERTLHTPLGLSIVTQAAFLHETIELMQAR
ncbi:trypsin-like serine peptidase [Schlesneria sp.]|uniref:trypsin-like serine peptidase n=1 Tax=Schlesneria sp. TaxID=2762018 RepID=UPI002EE1C80D